MFVSQNSINNKVKKQPASFRVHAEKQLDHGSSLLTVVIYQSVAHQIYLLLEARTLAFSKHNCWL